MNATRHARAHTIEVTVLVVDDQLEIIVDDDGEATANWEPGVGIVAMRERTGELGASLLAGPQGTGGRVRACLPIVVPDRVRSRECSPEESKPVAGGPESAASIALQVAR